MMWWSRPEILNAVRECSEFSSRVEQWKCTWLLWSESWDTSSTLQLEDWNYVLMPSGMDLLLMTTYSTLKDGATLNTPRTVLEEKCEWMVRVFKRIYDRIASEARRWCQLWLFQPVTEAELFAALLCAQDMAALCLANIEFDWTKGQVAYEVVCWQHRSERPSTMSQLVCCWCWQNKTWGGKAILLKRAERSWDHCDPMEKVKSKPVMYLQRILRDNHSRNMPWSSLELTITCMSPNHGKVSQSDCSSDSKKSKCED